MLLTKYTISLLLIVLAFVKSAVTGENLLDFLLKHKIRNKKPQIDQRIVGGVPSNINTFPYQLSLRVNGRHVCGASIIGASYALTAAHCVDNPEERNQYSILAGTEYRTRGGVNYNVQTVTSNPKYNKEKIDYDVAVIRIVGEFAMNERVKIIPLARTATAAGTNAVVSGWGKLRNNGLFLPARLQSARVPVVDLEQCRVKYGEVNQVTERMICAGGNGRQDSCQGDSGGPLVADGNQIGVVSWGVACGKLRMPGVYTNLANPEIRAWISANTGGI